MSSDLQLQELTAWLAKNFVDSYLSQFQTLGVRIASDLALITADDLSAMQMPPIHCRRVLASAKADFPPAPLPPPAMVPVAASAVLPSASGGGLDVAADPPAKRSRLDPQRREGNEDSLSEPVIEASAGEVNAEGSGEGVALGRKNGRGKGKKTPSGRARAEECRARGGGRVRPSKTTGPPAGASQFSASASDPQLPSENGCRANCSTFLKNIEPQLAGARRTEAEIALMEKRRKAAPTSNRSQSVFNYQRLKEAVARLCFDSEGNWLVHEKCCRKFLGVSGAWMANTHALAVSSRQIVAAGNVPDKVTHGLLGKSSNASKGKERDAFREFVIENRSPSGSTVTTEERFYLDPKWRVFSLPEKHRDADGPPSFCTSLLEALANKNLKPVSTRSVVRWMETDFGAFRQENGNPVPNEDHTSLFPLANDG